MIALNNKLLSINDGQKGFIMKRAPKKKSAVIFVRAYAFF